MATTQEKISVERDRKPSEGRANSESINSQRSSDNRNVDNGENQVSNGTKSIPGAPGIAKVGNTGAERTSNKL